LAISFQLSAIGFSALKGGAMQDFRNLTVWQMARQLTKSIYKLTMDFPRSEEFGLKSQMRRASVSICTNVAEGCGRRGDREFRTEAMQEQILEKLIQIKRMWSSLASKLLSSIEKQRRLRRSSKAAAKTAVHSQMTPLRADS
jgi:hypothetical protein